MRWTSYGVGDEKRTRGVDDAHGDFHVFRHGIDRAHRRGSRTTVSLGPVEQHDRIVWADLTLHLALPLPPRDAALRGVDQSPGRHAGLEIQRALFAALVEQAERHLVLAGRHGEQDAGVQLRGTRPFRFRPAPASRPSAAPGSPA